MAKPQSKPTNKPAKAKRNVNGQSKTALSESGPCMLIIPAWTGQVQVSIPGQGTFTATITTPAREVELPACACTASCCAACDGIATGKWGIPLRDAAGTWQCLEGPAGPKVLKCDENGPFWANE